MSRAGASRADPRDLPAYALSEASRHLHLPASTVRLWTLGQAYPTQAGGRKAAALVPVAQRKPLTLSFWNLLEVEVLSVMRRREGITMQRIRRALDHVGRGLGIERPLIRQEFLTDGVDLFLERGGLLVNVSARGQRDLRTALDAALRRVRYDQRGLASRFSPWRRSPAEPEAIEIDPRRSFGRPVIVGTGIAADAVVERFSAGEGLASIATDLRLELEQVERAVRWSVRGAEAA
jgi:uncharacterized protein (DUF433 family)